MKKIVKKVFLNELKGAFRRDLIKFKEQKPRKTYKINLFNSGFIISTERIRRVAIERIVEMLQ